MSFIKIYFIIVQNVLIVENTRGLFYFSDILPESSIIKVFGAPLKPLWTLRFIVHIKCRGVLTTKGYLLCLSNV